MRSIVSIVLCALAIASAEGEVRFTAPMAFPDLGLEMPVLADAVPEAPDMPRAEAFLITQSDGGQSLEDRFDTYDLWFSRTLRGRWRDVDGNRFMIARLFAEPLDDTPGTLLTRCGFEERVVRRLIDPEDDTARDAAVVAAAPDEVQEEPVQPRRGHRRNLEELLYYPSANPRTAVWVFRPAARERGQKRDWYLAALVLDAEENSDAAAVRFDEDFLDKVRLLSPDRESVRAKPRAKRDDAKPTESELFARDYRAQTVNYARWHFAAQADVLVTDDLSGEWRGAFVKGLTNELPRLRKAYAAAVPSPLTGATNATAAVRVFQDKTDYLAYVGEDMAWSAALWSPVHRELVLFLPPGGSGELLRTVRHEAFHQYLAYAGAMAEAAPWFNEGHAELFRNTSFNAKGEVVFERDRAAEAFVRANAEKLAGMLGAFLEMDYEDFYTENAQARQANYYLAWSLAYFLQVGAPEVRFKPFATWRADYMAALVKTRDGAAATRAVVNTDGLHLLAAEWKRFWTR